MFLDLAHTRMEVYQFSQQLSIECYMVTKSFPTEEKFSLVQQIRRAALSVHLNLAEGFSRKSMTERKRFFEIARGSLVEVDAAIEIAHRLGYVILEHLQKLGTLIIKTFKLLSGLIRNTASST